MRVEQKRTSADESNAMQPFWREPFGDLAILGSLKNCYWYFYIISVSTARSMIQVSVVYRFNFAQ
jgi:hypothetical protein